VLKIRKNETTIWLRLFQSLSVAGLCSGCSASWLFMRLGEALAVLGVLHVDAGFESSPTEENRFSIDSDDIFERINAIE
jgi:hypothetical protein